jgi:hypothetical protein
VPRYRPFSLLPTSIRGSTRYPFSQSLRFSTRRETSNDHDPLDNFWLPAVHGHAALWICFTPIWCQARRAPPQRRRDVTFRYLSSAEKVLGGPGFAYVGQWCGNTSAILEFENDIDGMKINGVDMITFGDDGRITHFKVMVRPLKAINLVHRLMGEATGEAIGR